MVKTLSQYLSHLHSPFYFSIFAMLNPAIVMMIFPYLFNFGEYTTYEFSIAAMTGVSNFLAQIFLSLATAHENVTILGPLHYLEVIIAFLSDVLIFGVTFQLNDLSGMMIISV